MVMLQRWLTRLDDKNTVGANYTYLHKAALDFSHQDLGFHANGNVAGLGYKGEVDFQFGSVGTTCRQS